mgnify:CR=1 FL=1
MSFQNLKKIRIFIITRSSIKKRSDEQSSISHDDIDRSIKHNLYKDFAFRMLYIIQQTYPYLV